MLEVETGRFTVGVFQDVAWAQKGIEALKKAGLPPEALSVIAKEGPEVAQADRAGARRGGRAPRNGRHRSAARPRTAGRRAAGSASDFARLGIAGTMRRVGFQAHDGRIFEVLTARGGVLVAIHSEPRAADALAILHSYGGGNAAIGAWTGRV